jgi:hypothetical protein
MDGRTFNFELSTFNARLKAGRGKEIHHGARH